MGFVDPLTATVVAFCFLGILVYKRVNLGITLNVTALLMALLVLDLPTIWTVIANTTTSSLTISLVVATFGIMLLSLLYKETKTIDILSSSLGKLVNNAKLTVSLLPAAIGLLPVGGGALMSAPLVEAEAEKLGLKEDKRTYVNFWFRHTIFPVYPVSQVLILAATLTGVSVAALIIRQIPIVLSMVLIGYVIGLRKTTGSTKTRTANANRGLELRRFAVSFLPILSTIVIAVLGWTDVSLAPFVGVVFLLTIARPSLKTVTKPLRNWGIWGITLAAYGAFLLRNAAEAIGISQVFGSFVSNGGVDPLLLLIVIPAFLGAITGSPSGGIAISVSILTGIVGLTAKAASLLYMSSYLGYVVAPTHLCLILTAEYFKCPLGRLYRYVIPSILVSFAATVVVYFVP